MYIVVEIEERDMLAVHTAETYNEAVSIANAQLKAHCESLGYTKEFEEYVATVKDDPNVNEDSSEIHLVDAAAHQTNAWCNWQFDWDAHIVKMA